MQTVFKSRVAVIGGDRRQIAVAAGLGGLFEQVCLFGHPENETPRTVHYVSSIGNALAGARTVVLPITGMNDAGLVRSYKDQPAIEFGAYFERLTAGTLVVAGSLTARWRATAASLGIPALEYAEEDEIAILNSIPTAEGAVQIAMEELPITIHGSTVLVIGFGRVGLTVARTFKALGARVIVSARRAALLARVVEMGCESVADEAMDGVIGQTDIIINTVPAMVLPNSRLVLVPPRALIIDLASAPGGVDFEAAAQLNLKAKLYPGLPGIVAPETAGAILATSIPKLIRNYYAKNGGVR